MSLITGTFAVSLAAIVYSNLSDENEFNIQGSPHIINITDVFFFGSIQTPIYSKQLNISNVVR